MYDSDSEKELLALLRLQCTPHIGDQTSKKLIAHCGSAAAVFRERKGLLMKLEGIGMRTVAELGNIQYQKAALKEFRFIIHNKLNWISFQDTAYPKYLKHCRDGPILLFTRGNFDLTNRRIISVVGTRSSTPHGNAFCEAFIEALVPLNPVIVSGFAYGIDIQVHKAAIKYGLPTLAILAHGLNRLYPRIHSRYASQLMQNGGFITEFWSSSKPDRENFLKRNRIIAGISEATVLVESAERGGGLITADLAHGYNRDVFAVPGRIGDPYSQGCNHLIKVQKAHMLTSVADLVYVLGWELDMHKSRSRQQELFTTLDSSEQGIYCFLEANGKQLLDDIALSCRFPVSQTATLLFGMEMKGCIRSLPGKFYEIIHS
ncbi:MAG: DNA-processing protein DprA [Eudoraea sp.]|nr:DNA-processing protein DprA [Eudoraea sp.]